MTMTRLDARRMRADRRTYTWIAYGRGHQGGRWRWDTLRRPVVRQWWFTPPRVVLCRYRRQLLPDTADPTETP